MSLSNRETELLALVANDELPGREVSKRYYAEKGIPISYGTLYTTFRRLKDQGLVTVREDEDKDGRVRFFKITGNGRRALDAARSHHSALAVFGIGFAT